MARRGGSNEIALLRQAETEAQALVAQAREGTSARRTSCRGCAAHRTPPNNRESLLSSFAAERKLKLRQSQAEAKKEVEEYRAARESKLRSVQPEVRCAAVWHGHGVSVCERSRRWL
jgi:hypothetical protein